MDWIYGNSERGRAILLNIGLFIPFGYLLSSLLNATGKKRILLSAIVGLSFSLLIEIGQLLSWRGMFDTDDMITNVSGTIVGAVLYGQTERNALGKAVEETIPVLLVCAGLAGCFITAFPIGNTGGTAYEKLFDFDVNSVSISEKLSFQGTCRIYGRETPPYQIILIGEETGKRQIANTEITGDGFVAVVDNTGNEKVAIEIQFKGYDPMPTSTYINGDLVEYMGGNVPEPEVAGTDIETIVESGILKAFDPDNEVYVYQCGGDLYWLIGSEIDNNTEIIYHIHTDEPELLPEKRVLSGFDNRGFRVGSDNNLTKHMNCGKYMVFVKEIPTDYNVTAIVVGFNTDGRITWKQHFRVN